MRGFGYYWGLKEVVISLAWLTVLPTYFYTSLQTLNTTHTIRLLRLTSFGLLVIVGINFLGYYINIQTESQIEGFVGGNSKMMALFGISFNRIIFPFGAGVNGYGVVVALALVVAYYIYRIPSMFSKAVAMLVAAACFFSLAAADSRAALAAALLVIVIWKFFPQLLSSRMTGLFVLLSLLGPPLLTTLPEILPASIVEMISRSNRPANMAEMLTTGRVLFWQGVYDDLINHPFNLIFGYGPYSQAVSDAGTEVGRLFGRGGAVGQFTFHSTSAQIAMDSGVFGIIAFYALALTVANALSSVLRRNEVLENTSKLEVCRLLMSMFLVLMLTGATESIATIYLRDSMIIFVTISAVASCAYLLWPAPPYLSPRSKSALSHDFAKSRAHINA